MKLITLGLILCLSGGVWSGNAATDQPEKKGWILVWNDEFDYSGLPDSSKWSYDTAGNAWGWGNNEAQYYTSDRKENAWVADGKLKITARKEALGGKEFTSARLVSKGKGDWLYGRFEICAKLPGGRGTWPAIWMLPTDWEYGDWPKSGEIDIMENVGYDPETIVGSAHTEKYNHAIHTQKNANVTYPDCYSRFHVYTLEWEKEEYRLYVDDRLYFTFKNEGTGPEVWPFDKRFHLLLNLAVGGNWGGQKGIDETLFPHVFEIDYVRVYQRSEPQQTYNSFTPGEYWPDNNGVHINAHGGGMLQQGDTYYWFGEHKTAGSGGNQAQVGVHCYSSEDLYNWRDEGIALTVVTDDPGHSIAKGCILERPKVIYNKKNRQYVMWFHLEPKGAGYTGAMSGVAVSDKVNGPYRFIKAFRPNAGSWPLNVREDQKKNISGAAKESFGGGSLPTHPDSLNLFGRDREGGQMARDMNLFVDEDGTAYHIYASEENSTLQISRLTDDYTSYAGQYIRVFPGRFMEAPAMFKNDGKYYLIMSGCTGWAPNVGRSAVAASVMGPWQELKNPFVGKDAETSFHSQSTYVLPVPGKPDQFIYMGDRWTPENAIGGRYIWLPIRFNGDQPVIEWQDSWKY